MYFRLLFAALVALGLAGTAAAQNTAQPVITGYLTTSGCPSTALTPCFVQYGAGGASTVTIGAPLGPQTGAASIAVICNSGCSGGPSDESAFTAGASSITTGGFFQTTATSNPLTNGEAGSVQLTANRAFMVNLRNAAGAESGVAAVPLQVSLANTAANGTAVSTALNATPTLANGNGVVPTQGGNVLSATNGAFNNLLQGNAVLSATNGLYSNLLQGNAALSTGNPIFAQLTTGSAIAGKVGIDQTTDGTTNGVRQTTQYPSGAVAETASATGTTGATTATLATNTGQTTFICGFSIRANATAAATNNATVTGTITGTMNYTQWTAPLASGLGVTEEIFTPCIPASTTNTSIAVVSGAPGSGGVVSVSSWGYLK